MAPSGFKQMMAEATAEIETISVPDALTLVGDDSTLFVDVRESAEREASGGIAGSIHAPRGFLEFLADPEGPMHDEAFASGKRLVIYCGSGGRSALASQTLLRMGVENAVNLAGGFQAWNEANGPTEK